MKKTLIALMALGTTAMADGITLSTVNTSGNYNSNSHGFYLSLSSNEIQIKTPEVTLTDIVALDSMTIYPPALIHNSIRCKSNRNAKVSHLFGVG